MGTVLKIVGFSFLLLLCHLASLPGVVAGEEYKWSNKQLAGLQDLWTNWSSKTPNLGSNLLNWERGWKKGGSPCQDDIAICPCYNPTANWRGVTCLRFQNIGECNHTAGCTKRFDTWLVGLELEDSSIVGSLPPAIGKLEKLVTLSLTGNPKLTGSLPGINLSSILPLSTLDLHDNGFSGDIPIEMSKAKNLRKLDLSGNQLNGTFPLQFMNTTTLQDFRIARNKLVGTIQFDAFQRMIQLLIVDLSGNNFTGPPPNFSNLTKLHHLNLSYNSFTEFPAVSEVFKTWLPKTNQSQLGVLDLSGLNIGGRLPDWNSDLLSLEQLYLDNNGLSGELDFTSIQSNILRRISNHTLQVLSLRNNSIKDVIFDKTRWTDGQIKIYLQGNPYCNDESKDIDGRRCFCDQYCAISQEKDYLKRWLIIISIICGILLLFVIPSLVYFLHRKNQDMYALQKQFDAAEVSAKRFEYNVLRTATENFAIERKLGQGGYGAVFKGILSDGSEIAVKKLKMKTQEASVDFLNEVLLITNIQHRNLVALKGYCLHGKEMLLVYECVNHCDLEKLLFDGLNGQFTWEVLSWSERLKICLGVAQGLYYLHASSHTRIIHRDIKASNVLLDKNLNPKIADFGLARPMQDGKSEIYTRAAGTIGYLAPEYVLYGQLSDKADVYSFGVLLLEILSRCRNKDPSMPEDEVYLPTRALKLHKEDRLMEVLDPNLEVSEGEAMEVLETAIKCVQSSPEQRPSMLRVVALLAGDKDLATDLLDTRISWSQIGSPHTSDTEGPLFPRSMSDSVVIHMPSFSKQSSKLWGRSESRTLRHKSGSTSW